MTRNSCIGHTPRGRLLTIRQEYIDICQGAKYPLCAAAILHVFEHWTNHKLDLIEAEQRDIRNAAKQGKTVKARENRWIHMSQEDLKADELFGMFGETVVAKSLKDLAKLKYLKTRQNPSKKWDRTLQYWFEIEAVQEKINENRLKTEESQGAPIPYQYDMETVPVRHGDRTSTEAIPQDSLQDSFTIKEAPKNGAHVSTAVLPEVTFDDLPSYAESVANGAPPVKTKRRLLEEAIYEAFGWDETRVTKSEKGKVDAAVRDLWKAKYRAEHIPTIYRYCTTHYETFGPNALASNASEATKHGLNGSPPAAQSGQPSQKVNMLDLIGGGE